jgi:hypothetical protein
MTTPTYTTSFPLTLTSFQNLTAEIQGFNPALGTLLSVNETITVNGLFNGTITNNAASAETFLASDAVTVTVALASNSSLGQLSGTISANQTLSNVAGKGGQASFGAFTPTTSSQLTFNDAATLNLFKTSSMVSLSATGLANLKVTGGGGNVLNQIKTQAGGTVSVQYTYLTPAVSVPEPASIVMMLGGVGFFGTMLVRTQVRRQANI